MDNKIQELTEKIYHEGVEKGKEEANKIIAKAKEEESSLISEAQKKAEQIVANAKKEADELKKNTQSELKLFAAQSFEALKSEAVNLINGKIIDKNIKAVTEDKAFMQKVILTMAENWAKGEKTVIETEDAKSLKEYFASNAKELLNKEQVTIKEVNGIGTNFRIMPADGSYKIQLGDEEFASYFKEFLRPELVKMLF